jgi:hypothetical protein
MTARSRPPSNSASNASPNVGAGAQVCLACGGSGECPDCNGRGFLDGRPGAQVGRRVEHAFGKLLRAAERLVARLA